MERVILNNIIVKQLDSFLIMNLVSFRREHLTSYEYELFQSIGHKKKTSQAFSSDEEQLYKRLMASKQILPSEIINEADEIIKEKYLKFDYPIIRQATINLTYSCNFKCSYCYQRHFNSNTTHITVDDVDRIFAFLKMYQAQVGSSKILNNLCISGGEPLLPKNIETIKRILFLFENVEKKLFTNGINIGKYWDQIDFTKFKEIQISLDGDKNVIKAINKYNINDKEFMQLLEGIKKLADSKIKITIIVMLTQELLKHYENFMYQLKKHSLDSYSNLHIRFSTVVDYDSTNTLDENFYNKKEYLYLINQLKKSELFFNNCSIDALYEFSFLRNVLLRTTDNKDFDQKINCCNTNYGIPILFAPDGKIYWCNCAQPNKGIIGEYKPNFYFINEQILTFKKRNIFQIEECNKCDFRYVCGTGCPFHEIKTKKEINEPYPYCGAFKDKDIMDNLEDFILL